MLMLLPTTSATAVEKLGFEHRAAGASPKSPAVTAAVFRHEVGEQQRDGGLCPGLRRRPPRAQQRPERARNEQLTAIVQADTPSPTCEAGPQ